MKKIECIIRSEKVYALQEELRTIGIGGLTVSEVKGFGRETTRPENYLFLPKSKIEVYVTDDQVEDVLSAISKVCRTGQLGDGKVIVLPIEDMLRVRDGERKEAAIY